LRNPSASIDGHFCSSYRHVIYPGIQFEKFHDARNTDPPEPGDTESDTMTADSPFITSPVSYAQRIADLAAERGERTALIFVAPDGSESYLSWAELDTRANQMARLLAGYGVGPTTLLAICLPTRAEHIVAAIAAWRLGACTLPLSPQMPERERREILAVSESWRTTVMLVEHEGQYPGDISLDELSALDTVDASALPAITAWPGKAICSGGSTGRPKIILDDRPWQTIPGQIRPARRPDPANHRPAVSQHLLQPHAQRSLRGTQGDSAGKV
jgi:non-ribosomal peptide synthetase component F